MLWSLLVEIIGCLLKLKFLRGYSPVSHFFQFKFYVAIQYFALDFLCYFTVFYVGHGFVQCKRKHSRTANMSPGWKIKGVSRTHAAKILYHCLLDYWVIGCSDKNLRGCLIDQMQMILPVDSRLNFLLSSSSFKFLKLMFWSSGIRWMD